MGDLDWFPIFTGSVLVVLLGLYIWAEIDRVRARRQDEKRRKGRK